MMSRSRKTRTNKTVGSLGSVLRAIVLAVSLLIFGLLAGGFVVSRLFGGSGGMGWDHLADALGGAMVGILIALVLTVALLFWASRRIIIWSAVAAILGSIALIWLLQVTKPKWRDQPVTKPVPTRPGFEPAFQVSLWTSPKERVLFANSSRLDRSRLEINGRGRSLTYRTWGQDPELCVVNLDEPILEALAKAVADLNQANITSADCPPCRDCPMMNLSWSLEDQRGALQASDQCLLDNETLSPLTELAQAAANMPTSQCEAVGDPNPFDPAQLPRIEVSSNRLPIIDWTPAGAVEILVALATPPDGFDISPASWHIVSPPGGSFAGPVIYGELPTGAKVATNPQTLVSGVEYRVTVRRPDPGSADSGFDSGRHEYDASATFIAK